VIHDIALFVDLPALDERRFAGVASPGRVQRFPSFTHA